MPRSSPALLAGLVSLTLLPLPSLSADGIRKNILMFAIDDLRPMLSCYGDDRIRTPHVDRLAASGMLFERAYCNYSKYGPSRLSLMTGLRPSSVGVYTHRAAEPAAFRARRPDALSIARWLRDHDYETRSFGKIDHDGWQIAADWSAPPFAGREGEMLEIAHETDPTLPTFIAPRHECPVQQFPEVPDDHFFEGRMTNEVIAQLTARSRTATKPFFFAVGYRRPHLPFVAPRRYLALYPPDPSWLAPNPEPPRDAPPFAWFNSDGYAAAALRHGLTIPESPDWDKAVNLNGYELRSYLGVPRHGPIPPELQIDLARAYAACVSYVDAQIGRILDHLDQSGLRETTILILWSGHGWHLGEMSAWGKMTNYEIATQVPLIVSVPGLPPGRTRSLTELVDLYPSLCELAGVPIPDHLEGLSFVPVLENPATIHKEAVFHDYVRHRSSFTGQAVRTDRYRYVLWHDKSLQPTAEELYDLNLDPAESVNLAPGYPNTLTQLRKLLHSHHP